MTKAIAAAFLFVSTLFAQEPSLLRHFDYDQKSPLDHPELTQPSPTTQK